MTHETKPTETFLEEMRWRGFFQQCTDEAGLADLLAQETVTGYIGFDPTASSLHAGSLLPIMGLMHLQRHGHRPIAIAGGGTALVGDPSGKAELRQLLTEGRIAENLVGIRGQLARFLDFGDPALSDLPHGPVVKAAADGYGVLVNNADWLRELNYVEFLREVGRHFSVNQMLTRDSVKLRLETGLSFLEFNYMIFQAYDFFVLNRDHGCRLQMGGSDQWGNIVSGVDLCRRINQQEVFGLTFPLLQTAAGEKMGKTVAGAVWLDPKQTSPYDWYQYWINCDDRDVGRFLRLYTLLPRERVEELEALEGADVREAKRALACAVTELVHGPEEAEKADRAARALFGGGAGDESAVPSTEIPAADLDGEGLALIDALAVAGLCKSKSDARRNIRQGGVRVNGDVVGDELRRLGPGDVQDGRLALQVGKKRHHHLVIA